MEKGKEMKSKAAAVFGTAGTRNGAYSVGLTAAVLAVVIVLNLIVGQIPEGYRNIDVSSTKIYEISETSRELLADLDQEVDLTVLAIKDETDERIRTFISKYAGLSDQIHVEWIDPVLHPGALTEYDTSENTIVVSCPETGKTTTVAFGDILVMDSYLYYSYGTTSYAEFDGDGQLTGAVGYVTNDTERIIYQSAGHGEQSLSDTITDLMNKNSFTLSEINLLMTDSVPDDCGLFLMYGPSADLTEGEVEMLGDYLDRGGKVMVLLGEKSGTDLPNLSGLLEEYGIRPVEGYIADPVRCYQNNYYSIFPELSVSGDMAAGIDSEMVLLVNVHGLELTDPQRDTISTTAFMSSSDQAFAATETSQEQGQYVIGATAVEAVGTGEDEDLDAAGTSDEDETSDAAGASDEDETSDTAGTSDGDETSGSEGEASGESGKESRLTVISGASLIDSQITDIFTTLENTTLFMNAVTANFEGVQNLSIEAKSLGVEYNAMQHTGIFSLLVVFGIPAVIIIGGFAVWFRRRKR